MRELETYLGNFGILEPLLPGDAVPVDVGAVLGVLDDGVEEHGLGGGGLLLALGGVSLLSHDDG